MNLNLKKGTEVDGVSVHSFAPTQTKKKNWSTPVDEKMILEYMRNPTSNKMVKNQYDLYRNKNEYIDRLNKLIPMEILMPLGGAGFAGYELNKE